MRRRIVCLKKGTVGQSNFDCSHLNVAISNMATLDIVTLDYSEVENDLLG